jgi:hypothetical protein
MLRMIKAYVEILSSVYAVLRGPQSINLNYNLRYSWPCYRTVAVFGLRSGLRTSTDPPVKIVGPLAQHQWSSYTLYLFNTLTFYEVMLCFR